MDETKFYVLLGIVTFLFITFSLKIGYDEPSERELRAEVIPIVV